MSTPPSGPGGEAGDRGRETKGPILVIEDDAQVRGIVSSTLADEGWVVLGAADGQEALDLAATQPPALVVLDLTLPVLDGFTVARRLRAAQGPGLPILVMSADGSVAEKARRVGAFAYLRKPFDLEILVLAARRGLGEA